jgi:SP family sugar porter-like MFS transporter
VRTSTFNSGYIFSISLISALGGLLFGYDWVVIGGAKPFYERFFGITEVPVLQGWLVSCAIIGCIIGAMLSGYLSDRFGRKRPLILTALVFIISAIGTGASGSIGSFVFFRIVGGVAIGLASNLSPMYIAEVAPENIRGRFVSLSQLTIVIGILLAQTANWWIADPVPSDSSNQMIVESWNGRWGWRWMFWAENVAALMFFILMFLVPESPRWLAKNQRFDESSQVLQKIGGLEFARKSLDDIKATISNKVSKTGFRDLLAPELRTVLTIGIVLAVLQQWCGINVIFNYAEEVFEAAGYDVSDILFNIIITGSVNLVFTFIAIYTVDRLGRKALMMIGTGGLAVIYLFLGIAYQTQLSGWPMLVMIVVAIACYAMTLGPVVWVVLSEIFPNRIRGIAMSVGTMSLWIACFVLTYTFPILNNIFNTSGTFWLYAVICLAGFVFVYRVLPETKNKTLEELEQILIKKK